MRATGSKQESARRRSDGRSLPPGPRSEPAPEVSIVIPIYNEEGILSSSVVELRTRLLEASLDHEILLAENGSTDGTVGVAESLAEKYAQVRVRSTGEPNYGRALRHGILDARGRYVICDEIDLCDVDFYLRALTLLRAGEADLVVGSKVMPGANDRRPLFRRAATLVVNGMLRAATGFRGTDTHGLKAFRRDLLAPVAARCQVERDLFASEFVIRCGREGFRVVEIPVEVMEKRQPSIHLFRRVPNVLLNMGRLAVLFRLRGP